jgi:hypothetical protein
MFVHVRSGSGSSSGLMVEEIVKIYLLRTTLIFDFSGLDVQQADRIV